MDACYRQEERPVKGGVTLFRIPDEHACQMVCVRDRV